MLLSTLKITYFSFNTWFALIWNSLYEPLGIYQEVISILSSFLIFLLHVTQQIINYKKQRMVVNNTTWLCAMLLQQCGGKYFPYGPFVVWRVCNQYLGLAIKCVDYDQLSAETEVWKSINTEYCLSDMFQLAKSNTRAVKKSRVITPKVILSRLRQNSFLYPSCKLWNCAPVQVTQAKSLAEAKREIRAFAKTLPLWYQMWYNSN